MREVAPSRILNVPGFTDVVFLNLCMGWLEVVLDRLGLPARNSGGDIAPMPQPIDLIIPGG